MSLLLAAGSSPVALPGDEGEFFPQGTIVASQAPSLIGTQGTADENVVTALEEGGPPSIVFLAISPPAFSVWLNGLDGQNDLPLALQEDGEGPPPTPFPIRTGAPTPIAWAPDDLPPAPVVFLVEDEPAARLGPTESPTALRNAWNEPDELGPTALEDTGFGAALFALAPDAPRAFAISGPDELALAPPEETDAWTLALRPSLLGAASAYAFPATDEFLTTGLDEDGPPLLRTPSTFLTIVTTFVDPDELALVPIEDTFSPSLGITQIPTWLPTPWTDPDELALAPSEEADAWTYVLRPSLGAASAYAFSTPDELLTTGLDEDGAPPPRTPSTFLTIVTTTTFADPDELALAPIEDTFSPSLGVTRMPTWLPAPWADPDEFALAPYDESVFLPGTFVEIATPRVRIVSEPDEIGPTALEQDSIWLTVSVQAVQAPPFSFVVWLPTDDLPIGLSDDDPGTPPPPAASSKTTAPRVEIHADEMPFAVSDDSVSDLVSHSKASPEPSTIIAGLNDELPFPVSDDDLSPIIPMVTTSPQSSAAISLWSFDDVSFNVVLDEDPPLPIVILTPQAPSAVATTFWTLDDASFNVVLDEDPPFVMPITVEQTVVRVIEDNDIAPGVLEEDGGVPMAVTVLPAPFAIASAFWALDDASFNIVLDEDPPPTLFITLPAPSVFASTFWTLDDGTFSVVLDEDPPPSFVTTTISGPSPAARSRLWALDDAAFNVPPPPPPPYGPRRRRRCPPGFVLVNDQCVPLNYFEMRARAIAYAQAQAQTQAHTFAAAQETSVLVLEQEAEPGFRESLLDTILIATENKRATDAEARAWEAVDLAALLAKVDLPQKLDAAGQPRAVASRELDMLRAALAKAEASSALSRHERELLLIAIARLEARLVTLQKARPAPVASPLGLLILAGLGLWVLSRPKPRR